MNEIKGQEEEPRKDRRREYEDRLQQKEDQMYKLRRQLEESEKFGAEMQGKWKKAMSVIEDYESRIYEEDWDGIRHLRSGDEIKRNLERGNTPGWDL